MTPSRIKSKSFVSVGMLLPPVKGVCYKIHDYTFVVTTTASTTLYLYSGSSYNAIDPAKYGTVLDIVFCNGIVTALVVPAGVVNIFNGSLYSLLYDPDLFEGSPGEGIGVASSIACTILSGSHIRFEEWKV